MSSKIINYTNRDYESLKAAALNFAKQYYPETYQDFNESSVGAMLIDIQCFIGDILSFYLDYQANETFLDSAQQYDNIIKHAKQKGFRDTGKPSAISDVNLYIIIPANSVGQPDSNYLPILEKNSSFIVPQTNASYLLLDDVDFSSSNTEFIVASVSSTGIPETFACKLSGKVISGALYTEKITIESFENFLKIKISNPLMSEIISIIDSNGNEYYQVDYLTQNVVYKYIKNNDYDSSTVPYKLVKLYCPRRFIIEQHNGYYYVVFGNGSIDSIADPRKILTNYYSREFISERTIDPTNINHSDKFGIAPTNTTLTIVYRANNVFKIGAGTGQLNKVSSPILRFGLNATNQTTINSIRNSLEIENIVPISSLNQIITSDELKRRAYGAEASQFRCVTKQDIINAVYRLDPKLGSIKLANAVVDRNSPRRNINLYVLGEDNNGYLTTCSQTLKNNLKLWLSPQKIMGDFYDILDAKIVNFAIEFVCDTNNSNKNLVLVECVNALKELFSVKNDIGQSLSIASIYKKLNLLNNVIDAKKVKIILKNGFGYSSIYYDFYGNLSADGSYIIADQDIVFELKYPEQDIIGTII